MHAGLYWVVLKVAQRCNLNCSYCYVYNRGDTSWKARPKFVTDDVVEAFGKRIREQSQKYNLDRFVVELHGGEPLLYGKKRTVSLIRKLRALAAPTELVFLLQTNGLLLDQEWLQILYQNRVGVGISIDGPPEFADKYRVYHDGSGSTGDLLKKIASLRKASDLFDKLNIGYLCVMNPVVGGRAIVDWFVDQSIESFDLLWPHGNYVNYPDDWAGCAPYTRFLIDAFDRWFELDAKAPRIRLFEVMILGLMGLKPVLDALGGDLRNLCVVESNGAIGVSDVVRFLGGDFATDRLNIFDHPLDVHADHFEIGEIQTPCDTCQKCPFLKPCGGGYLQDRFDGASFDNPSIYCETLYATLEHIMVRLREELPPSVWVSRRRPALYEDQLAG